MELRSNDHRAFYRQVVPLGLHRRVLWRFERVSEAHNAEVAETTEASINYIGVLPTSIGLAGPRPNFTDEPSIVTGASGTIDGHYRVLVCCFGEGG